MPLREILRTQFALMAACVAMPTQALEYTDVDVEEIQVAIREFYADPIIQIGPASARCTYTAEDPCEAEARVFLRTPERTISVRVSKVDGHWIIGRWQKEVIEFRECTKTKSRSECRGPSGRVGGRRY